MSKKSLYSLINHKRAHLHIATNRPSSTFHRSYIEFFVIMHEVFDEIYLSQFFSAKLHRHFIENFVHDQEKFDEMSMKLR